MIQDVAKIMEKVKEMFANNLEELQNRDEQYTRRNKQQNN